MKRLSFLVATLSVIGWTAIVAPSPTHALSGSGMVCPIGFTGPSSTNVCTSETHYTCNLKNDNTIVFDNGNQQVASTGTSTTAGNTSSGNAITGSATNSNNVTYTGTVTNGTTCVATVTTPAVPPASQPTASVVAPAAVGGAGATSGGLGATTAPTALPNTAAPSPLVTTVTLVGSAASLFALARLALFAYGRRSA